MQGYCEPWGQPRWAEPCLWVKLVLSGLGTQRRAAESGQYGVTFSVSVRGWYVSDRPVRGSG